MNPYKPEIMGSIAPFDEPALMEDFLKNKYDSFCTLYDCIKDQTSNIESISPVEITQTEDNLTTLSIAIEADSQTLESIKTAADNTVSMFGNILTAQ